MSASLPPPIYTIYALKAFLASASFFALISSADYVTVVDSNIAVWVGGWA